MCVLLAYQIKMNKTPISIKHEKKELQQKQTENRVIYLDQTHEDKIQKLMENEKVDDLIQSEVW